MATQTLIDRALDLQVLKNPVIREIPADLETPISVYLKLKGLGPSFLLESVTGGEQVARYSFLGVQPRRAFVFRRGQVEIRSFHPQAGEPGSDHIPIGSDLFAILREALQGYDLAGHARLPRFLGGLVGYMGYELTRYFEPATGLTAQDEIPEAIFLQTDLIVAFDHAYGKMLLIGVPDPNHALSSHDEIEARLDQIERRLRQPIPEAEPVSGAEAPGAGLRSNLDREDFAKIVREAKEYIAAGDAFQIVLSQRFERETSTEPFEIYRALRRLNPSPYMFFFDFDGLAGDERFHVLGASPEMHARLEGRMASLRPIAGTRRRGKTPKEDAELEQELLADPKERAEHVMLVDLGRNDLGRICEYGSVRTPEQMLVERYSHVMHIVSHVEGRLRPGLDAFDLLQATFPAGTVSGAPKIRAMQLIHELEATPRNIYAGLVGYLSYNGSMDTCIAIRTLVMRGSRVSIQAGAGIVADSDPDREYDETVNKAKALAAAVTAAEQRSGGAA